MSSNHAEEEGREGTDTITELDASIPQKNLKYYRELSLRLGGFGEERIHAWPYLLHVQLSEGKTREAGNLSLLVVRESQKISSKVSEKATHDEEKVKSKPPSPEQHPDEHQIMLDTNRSFVLYPQGHEDREELQADLHVLITTIFRRHPALSYFQGYHDIITVLFLTLPEELQLRCAEHMSLHRLRDAMGKSLEPLIGLLRILKYLLRLADSEYAALLERNTPLPYFALSNLLTLFSHDIPTLPLIQHVFDYLLSRPPIASVYLAAAITLARKDEAKQMEEEDEEGMLHSLLSSLPELKDEDESPVVDEVFIQSKEPLTDIDKFAEASLQESRYDTLAGDERDEGRSMKAGEEPDRPLSSTEKTSSVEPGLDQSLDENVEPPPKQYAEVVRTSQPSDSFTGKSDTQIGIGATTSLDADASIAGSGTAVDYTVDDLPLTKSSPSSPSPSPSDFPQQRRKKRPKVSLPALLAHADILYQQFPPSHPSLHLSEIIGPKSVIFTWSEDPAQLLSDAEAEAVVIHPELVTLPYVDPDELPHSKEGSDSDQYDSDHSPKKGRRKLHRKRRRRGPPHFGIALDRKTVLTGAVVALGLAVAVYSMRARYGNGHSPNGFLDAARAERFWRKTGRWVGGALIGGSEKLLETFGW